MSRRKRKLSKEHMKFLQCLLSHEKQQELGFHSFGIHRDDYCLIIAENLPKPVRYSFSCFVAKSLLNAARNASNQELVDSTLEELDWFLLELYAGNTPRTSSTVKKLERQAFRANVDATVKPNYLGYIIRGSRYAILTDSLYAFCESATWVAQVNIPVRTDVSRLMRDCLKYVVSLWLLAGHDTLYMLAKNIFLPELPPPIITLT